MSHQICLKLPLLCMMAFSVIVGREQQKSTVYLCGDPACKEAISEAYGRHNYNAPFPDQLSFGREAKIRILGKPADKTSHWIGQIGDKIGLVPQTVIREDRVIIRNPEHQRVLHELPFHKPESTPIHEHTQPESEFKAEILEHGKPSEVPAEEQNVHGTPVENSIPEVGPVVSEVNPSVAEGESTIIHQHIQPESELQAEIQEQGTPAEALAKNQSIHETPVENSVLEVGPVVSEADSSIPKNESTVIHQHIQPESEFNTEISEEHTSSGVPAEEQNVHEIPAENSILEVGPVVEEVNSSVAGESIHIHQHTEAQSEFLAEILEQGTSEEILAENQTIHEMPAENSIPEGGFVESEGDSSMAEGDFVLIHQDQHTPLESEFQAEIPVGEQTIRETPVETSIPEVGPVVSEADSSVESEEEHLDLTQKHDHPRPNPLLEHGHQHLHSHEPACRAKHEKEKRENEEESEFRLKNSVIMAMRHLSASLVGLLPEHLQAMILDVNDALVFTGIIALTLVSICVPYFFIETFLSVRPLKKKVTDLNKTLWKVSTAFENQQEEYDIYKEKALAYDEDKKQVEELELELHLIKQIEMKLKEENRSLKKRIKTDIKVAGELETLMTSTMNERDEVIDERDKLKVLVLSLQAKLNATAADLEAEQADAASAQMDLQLLTHTNENLKMRGEALEKEIGELKTKLNKEIEVRRDLQVRNDSLLNEKMNIEDELVDLKSVLHKYEATVNDLNDEISLKEIELLALKDTLGEDSPLVDIAEVTAKLKGVEGQASSLQARVESITIENTGLIRDIERAKKSLEMLQSEKEQAETRLQVLEAYFKEKEEELRRMVEKHEAEKEIRGKDKDELVKMIEEKNDEVRDLLERLEKLKEEFEETKLANRTQVRALEAKGHETWLSLCQSERKAQEGRKEAELLRQKLTAIAKAKEAEGNDALSLNGDVPYIFAQLDLDEVPLPLPDEPVLPSYFGLGDFEPPLPMDYDEDEDETLNSMGPTNRRGSSHEPQRPPPLGQMSPTFPDLSPIRGIGGRTERRDEYSDGSSSPPPPQGQEGSRENYMNGSMHSRHRQPLSASSPVERGFNL